MIRFHKILYALNGKNKSNLDEICFAGFPFEYRFVSFGFTNVNHRAPEELIMNVKIISPLKKCKKEYSGAPETFLLHKFSVALRKLNDQYVNVNKEIFLKARFCCQDADTRILKRSGIEYDPEQNVFILHVNVDMPVLNGVAINQKASERAVKDILSQICDVMETVSSKEIDDCIEAYRIQKQIRRYLSENHYCAFVANGSVLPRENDTDKPSLKAVPFISPKSLEISIPLDDATAITGMGIRCGITVITGGGYSGKSTLLDSLQDGIYDRLPGDGREFVITAGDALQTFAEDGRCVSGVDLSPFFKFLPDNNVANFTTDHASGSVSQAANIIEAICGGCRLLLVDEDKSAANLMVRDKIMRQVIKKEPIIPLTDLVDEFHESYGVSTIIVIGGCSEYLFYADCVIMMENYIAYDTTNEISEYGLKNTIREKTYAKVQNSRRVVPRKTDQAFLYFKKIMTEEQRKIVLDDYSVDITKLPAVKSPDQINTLMSLLMWLLCDQNANSDEMIRKLDELLSKLFSEQGDCLSFLNVTDRRYYEYVRPIDAYCCVNRVRGLCFDRNDAINEYETVK